METLPETRKAPAVIHRDLKHLYAKLAAAALAHGAAALVGGEQAKQLFLMSSGSTEMNDSVVNLMKFNVPGSNAYSALSANATVRILNNGDQYGSGYGASYVADDGGRYRDIVVTIQCRFEQVEKLPRSMTEYLALYTAVHCIAVAMQEVIDADTDGAIHTVLVRNADEETAWRAEQLALEKAKKLDRMVRKAVDPLRGGMRVHGKSRKVPIELLAEVPDGEHKVSFDDYGGKQTKTYRLTVSSRWGSNLQRTV